MRNAISITSVLLLSFGMLQPPALLAADATGIVRADVANGEAIYNQGKGNAMACSGCHGEKGLGMDVMESARLANVGQAYLLKQLQDYADGKRNDPGNGAVMNDIARAMDPQDRLDVVAYLDSVEYATNPSDLDTLKTEGFVIGNPGRGKTIMTKGIKSLVPPCQDCHGLSGRAQNVPAIHQQKYVYLVNQLKRYRDGTRANDRKVYKDGIMRGIAKKLSDENITDIAAYLSTATNSAP